jgi:hypothetical protein
MVSLWSSLILTFSVLAGPRIFLARVERTGLPPYTDDQGKIYILQGEACGTLRVRSRVVLQRPGSNLTIGTLSIVSVADGSAVGTMMEPGITFPMKGDEAIALPDLPPPQAAPPAAPPQPNALAPARSSKRATARSTRPKRKPKPPVS